MSSVRLSVRPSVCRTNNRRRRRRRRAVVDPGGGREPRASDVPLGERSATRPGSRHRPRRPTIWIRPTPLNGEA